MIVGMDTLSEILRAVKLQGALFFNGEFSAPWCFRSGRPASTAPLAEFLATPSAHGSDMGHLIIFHLLTEGRGYARLQDGERYELNAGDIVILPHGDPHFIGNGSPEKPVDSFVVFAKSLARGLRVTRFGGGGEITRFVCGFMACDPRLSEVFLAGLPPIFKVNVSSEPSGQWLAHSIRFSVDHAVGSSAGSNLVVSKLAEVLFIEALRRYISTMPPKQTGWLAGARDPFVGQALAHLHKQPAHPWTITDLAKRAGTSRTRLVARFRHYLSESPMGYLTRWRLKLGEEMLQSAGETVAAVAAAVGYGSEASYNRAFKREFGIPPASYRRKQSVPRSHR